MTVGTWFRVILASVLVGGLVGIATLLLLDWTSPNRITIGPATPASIVVIIDGAVATPGLVELPAGARLQQAIDAAGGLTADANVTGLNLAARIGDGEHITIPGASIPAQSGANQEGTPVPGLININTAGVDELDQLPGIGPVLAQRIIDFRELYGPFTSIDQLGEVSGISQDMVEELRPLVTIGG